MSFLNQTVRTPAECLCDVRRISESRVRTVEAHHDVVHHGLDIVIEDCLCTGLREVHTICHSAFSWVVLLSEVDGPNE